jgi:hypothetical protein
MRQERINVNAVNQLHWIGEEPGYYRHYFQNKATGKFYTLTDFRNVRMWHTTDCADGEPDMPLKDGMIIEIIYEGRVISREIISRVNDCTSVGHIVSDATQTN